MSYTAFVIDEEQRNELLTRYTPKFPDVYAHHVTLAMGHNSFLLTYVPKVVIYGYIKGIHNEVFLVDVDGETIRPDGSKYHITWSIDKSAGVKPVDSNKLIAIKTPIIIAPIEVKGSMHLC